MKALLRLALAADLVALLTVVLGSWTRINGAGLTCPDWPLCHGRLLPSMIDGTLWEWTHRLLAFAVAPLVIALIAVAWKQCRESRFIAPTLGVIVTLFIAQVFLGAETVRLSNTPVSVVLHWATAMALIAALSAMAVFAAASDTTIGEHERPGLPPLQAIAVGMTAIIAFVTMCVGAYVSSSGAGLACLSIPGCAGKVVVYSPEQYWQMVHRFAAGSTLVAAAASFALVWAFPASRRLRGTVALGCALVAVQILLGLLSVVFRLPTELREAHAVNAAFLFLTFSVAAIFAAINAAPTAEAQICARSSRQ